MNKILMFLCAFLCTATLCWAEGNVTPEWRDAGFNDYDASHWMVDGFDVAADAKAWRDAGYGPGAAKPWHKRHMTPNDASNWKTAGVKKAKYAKKLAKKGVTPEEYSAWAAKGYTKPKDILTLRSSGKTPETVPAQ